METTLPAPQENARSSPHRIYHALTVLPIAVGFLLTGLWGGLIGTLINRWLAQRPMRHGVKVAAMLGVALLATVGSLALAYATATVPKQEIGACVLGVPGREGVATGNTRVVDCAQPHDSQAVGVIRHPGQGPFPGAAAMRAFAPEPCLAAFKKYVGVDYESSSLEMTMVLPSDESWARGDRDIACMVMAGDGSQLTGSVEGSAH